MKYTILFLWLLFIACNQRPTSNEDWTKEIEGFRISDSVVQNSNLKNDIEGYWISSTHADSTVKNRTVVRYYSPFPATLALLIKIENDSVLFLGSIETLKTPLVNNPDSLISLDESGGYNFSYDKSKNLITAIEKKHRPNWIDTTIYVFRRLAPKEDTLLKDIFNTKYTTLHQLHLNFSSYYTTNIICGQYKPLGKYEGIGLVELGGSNDKSVIGFKDFKEFNIDAYFGTCHWSLPEDEIVFDKSNTGAVEIYSWEFNKDTFILMEMKSRNGSDRLYKDGAELRFLKIK